MSLLKQLKTGWQCVKQQAVFLSVVGASPMAYAGGEATSQDTIYWAIRLLMAWTGRVLILGATLICALKVVIAWQNILSHSETDSQGKEG